MSQKILSRRERVIVIPYLPPGIEKNLRKNNFFIPENIFFGPKLYPLLHFPGFQVKQKDSYVQISRVGGGGGVSELMDRWDVPF